MSSLNCVCVCFPLKFILICLPASDILNRPEIKCIKCNDYDEYEYCACEFHREDKVPIDGYKV